MRRTTNVSTPVAHLVGPGKVKVVNDYLVFTTGEEGEVPVRIDPKALRLVYCYGPVGMTDEAVQVLLRNEVEVAWLTAGGTRCHGRLGRTDASTTLLRIVQHRVLADPSRAREAAAAVVVAKLESQARAARHYQRHGTAEAALVVRQLGEYREATSAARTLDELRGLEGAGSAAWFGLLGKLLKAPWTFTQRVRRPPTDPVNALLSLGYTWVLQRVKARCEAAGLEVNVGSLHAYRAGRPSLACDLMEPLRVPGVDRWVVQVLNQDRAGLGDFVDTDQGIRLKPGAFARILREWESWWTETQQEAALDEVVTTFTTWLRATAPADLTTGSETDGEAL